MNDQHTRTPIPWRSLGQPRSTGTAPVVGGPRKAAWCPAPTTPNQLGVTWQTYNAPCPNK
jgi:hypothetical protein